MKKSAFWMQWLLLYTSVTFFYWKNKYAKVLNGDVHGTSMGPSCGTSRRPDDEMFLGRPQDVGHTCFLNSTQKYI